MSTTNNDIEYTGQYIREAPEIELLKLQLMTGARDFIQGTSTTPKFNLAQELAKAPYQAAGLSGLQRAAIGLVTTPQQVGIDGQGNPIYIYEPIQGGIGGYEQYFAGGQGSINAGQGLLGQSSYNLSGMNLSPQYQYASNMLGMANAPVGSLGQYQQQAGQGLPYVSQGNQQLLAASSGLPQYMQAGLSPATKALKSGLITASQLSSAGLPMQTMAGGTVNQGIQSLLGSRAAYNPNNVSSFMNPYQQEVTKKALEEIRRQGDMASQQAAAEAIKAGAFGGTREGVQRAELERNIQDVMSKRVTEDYAQNYAQAQQAAMQAFEQQQGRQLASGQALGQAGALQGQIGQTMAAILAQQAGLQGQLGQTMGQQAIQQAQLGQQGSQLLGQMGAQQAQMGLLPAQISAQQANIGAQQAQLYNQLGLGLGQLAQQYGGLTLQQQQALGQMGLGLGQLGIQESQLGEASQKAALGDINAIAQLGSVSQQARQAELDAARASQLQQIMAPFQLYSFLSDVYKGAPSTQMALSSSTAPSASGLQQITGLLGAVGSAAKAF